MVTLIMGLILTLIGVILSISIYIASVASVMKLYKIIDDTWFMIWDFSLYTLILWLLLASLNVFILFKSENK